MTDEYDPNAGLFSGEEPEEDPEKAHIEFTFGKNPNRTSAISDIFAEDMMATIDEDTELPEEAKKRLIFKMTANSVLDMVMECLDPDTREEVASSLDSYIGMCMVNMKYEVDLIGEMTKAVSQVERIEGESDEDFQRRLSDMEDAWWSIPQPRLDQRNPDDAIKEEMIRYGLDI